MDLSIEPKAGARTGLQRSGNVTCCFKLDSLGMSSSPKPRVSSDGVSV